MALDVLETEVRASGVPGAVADLGAVGAAAAAAATDRRATVHIDTDSSQRRVNRFAGFIGATFGTVTRQARTMGVGVASGLRLFSEGFQTAARGGRLVTDGLSAGQAAVQAFGGVLGGATKAFGGLVGMFGKGLVMMGLLVSVVPTLVGLLNAAGAASVGLVAALGPLVGLAAVLPGLFGAAAAGIGVLVLGVGALSKAYKAYKADLEDQKAQAGAVESAMDQQRAAADALAAAVDRLNRAREDYPEQVADAHDAVTGALLAEKRAALNLLDAQAELDKAQRKIAKSTYDTSRLTDDFTGKIYEIAVQSGRAADSADDLASKNLAVAEAEHALRRAKDGVSDSQRELNRLTEKGREGSEAVVGALRAVEQAQRSKAKADKAVADAAARNTSAHRKWTEEAGKVGAAGVALVKFLDSKFVPAWDRVRRGVVESLAPGATAGLTALMGQFDMFGGYLRTWAKRVGDAFADGMEALASPVWTDRLTEFFNGISAILPSMLRSVGNLVGFFLDLANAARPLTTWLVGAFERWTVKMDAWADKGGLPGFFKRTQIVAEQVWSIFGNVWAVLKNIGGAANQAFGTGTERGFLASLETITARWKEWTADPENVGKMVTWFREMGDNAKYVADRLGEAIKAMVEFGASDQFRNTIDSIENIVTSLWGFSKAVDESGVLPFVINLAGSVIGVVGQFIDLFGLAGVVIAGVGRMLAKAFGGQIMMFLGRLLLSVGTAIAGFVTLPGLLIAAAVAAVAALVFFVYKNWDVISKFWTDAFRSLKEKVIGWAGDISQWVTDKIIDPVKDFFGWITSLSVPNPFDGWKLPDIGAFADKLTNIPGVDLPAWAVPGRAVGGHVRAGSPYLVGERRPEIFVPDTSGRIMPRATPGATRTPPPLGGTGDSLDRATIMALVEAAVEAKRPIEVEQTFHEKADPRLMSAELAWRLG